VVVRVGVCDDTGNRVRSRGGGGAKGEDIVLVAVLRLDTFAPPNIYDGRGDHAGFAVG
jgi:hypothetical protein